MTRASDFVAAIERVGDVALLGMATAAPTLPGEAELSDAWSTMYGGQSDWGRARTDDVSLARFAFDTVDGAVYQVSGDLLAAFAVDMVAAAGLIALLAHTIGTTHNMDAATVLRTNLDAMRQMLDDLEGGQHG